MSGHDKWVHIFSFSGEGRAPGNAAERPASFDELESIYTHTQ